MNFGFFGVTDIVIVALFLLALFVGYKVGLMSQVVKIASAICGLFTAILFAKPFAAFIGPKLLNAPIYDKIYNNVITSDQLSSLTSTSSVKEGVTQTLTNLGFPGFLSSFISSGVTSGCTASSLEDLKAQIASVIATQMTSVAVVVISFFLLWIGTTIVFWILKLLIHLFRANKFIRVVDGLLGIIFNAFVSIIVIYVLLLVVSVLMTIPSMTDFNTFMLTDMQLKTDSFRLSKYLYDNNIIGNIIKMFL